MKLSEYLKKKEGHGDFHHTPIHHTKRDKADLPVWNLVNSLVIALLIVVVIILYIRTEDFGDSPALGNDTNVLAAAPSVTATPTPTATKAPAAASTTATKTPTATPTSTPKTSSYPPNVKYVITYGGNDYPSFGVTVDLDAMESKHKTSQSFTVTATNQDSRSITCEADDYQDDDLVSGTHSKWSEIEAGKSVQDVLIWTLDGEDSGDKVKLESKLTCYPIGDEEATTERSVTINIQIE